MLESTQDPLTTRKRVPRPNPILTLAALFALAMTACSHALVPVASTSPMTPNLYGEAAFGAFGAKMRSFSELTLEASLPSAPSASSFRKPAYESGCEDQLEFFSPDGAGDQHSSEVKRFYDAACYR
jgi:hypothetical protein